MELSRKQVEINKSNIREKADVVKTLYEAGTVKHNNINQLLQHLLNAQNLLDRIQLYRQRNKNVLDAIPIQKRVKTLIEKQERLNPTVEEQKQEENID